jgi:hypothetical protein
MPLSIGEITRRSREAPKQHTDVEVLFDHGLTAQETALQEEQSRLEVQAQQIRTDLANELDLLAQDPRASDPRPGAARAGADEALAPITAQLADIETRREQLTEQAVEFLVTFRFTALDGVDWNDITAHSAPREGVAEDAGRDYNLDEVARIAAARSGARLLPDGTTEALTAEEWDEVWATCPSPGLHSMKIALWYLNEYSWEAARRAAGVAARKVSTARPAATPTSPTTSDAPPADSTSGNPPASPSTSTTTTDASSAPSPDENPNTTSTT